MQSLFLVSCLLAAPLFSASPDDVSAYLSEMQAKNPSFVERLSAVAKASVGTTYADGPLGEGPEGSHDQDPLMDLTKVDCVTYVEQSVALAGAASYQVAYTDLQQIRYKAGKVGYETRNHFMVSDWLANNDWCTDISTTLDVDTVALTRNISRKDFFKLVKAPEYGQDTPDQSVTVHYIPSALTAKAEAKIPPGSLIVFVGKIDWLFALHCGLYLEDGLYHASSKAGKVVRMSLAEYVKSQESRYLGFLAYKIDAP